MSERTARPWGYWTRAKLAVLNDYLPAFLQAASGKSQEYVYLDAFAGEGRGVDRLTGEEFHGSSRIALEAKALHADARFTRLRYFERRARHASLSDSLKRNTRTATSRSTAAIATSRFQRPCTTSMSCAGLPHSPSSTRMAWSSTGAPSKRSPLTSAAIAPRPAQSANTRWSYGFSFRRRASSARSRSTRRRSGRRTRPRNIAARDGSLAGYLRSARRRQAQCTRRQGGVRQPHALALE